MRKILLNCQYKLKNLMVSAVLAVTFLGCDAINESDLPISLGGLSDSEIVEGLVEALNIGISSSVDDASKNGYLENQLIRIALPSDIQQLRNDISTKSIPVFGVNVKLNTVYQAYLLANPNIQNDLFDDLITAMNLGAQQAAPEAANIFVNALTNMTFTDALGILQGSDTAATHFFRNNTTQGLFNAFNPILKNELDDTRANTIYQSVVSFVDYQYLGVRVGDVIQVGNLSPSIDAFATNKAINGLFTLIGNQERNIREQPLSFNSIIEKVFNSDEAKSGRE